MTQNNNTKELDPAIVDAIELLVESELSDLECNQLLTKIESMPEYWRCMGIAFVEHQRLRRSVRKVCADNQRVTLQPNSNVHAMTQRNHRRWMNTIAIAASLLLMFSIGYLSASYRTTATDDHRIATNTDPIDPQPIQPSDTESINNDKAFPVARNVAGYVEWQLQSGVKLLPVFRGGEVDASWLESHPVQVDKRLAESLSRAGWEANPSRHFVSIKLMDGDSYTIPVDDIQYRFVGKRVY